MGTAHVTGNGDERPLHPERDHPFASIAVFEFNDGTVLRFPVLWNDQGEFVGPEDLENKVIFNPELDSKIWNIGFADEYVYRVADPSIRREIFFEDAAGIYVTKPPKLAKANSSKP
jgi:hypothetical protein